MAEGAFRNNWLLISGTVRNHSSVALVYRINFPSRDHALEYLSWAGVASIALSSCAPSVFLRYKSNDCFRLEENTTRVPSGLHTGMASMAGSNVIRFVLWLCRS